MSTTTHAPKAIDPSASLHAEALGLAKTTAASPADALSWSVPDSAQRSMKRRRSATAAP